MAMLDEHCIEHPRCGEDVSMCPVRRTWLDLVVPSRILKLPLSAMESYPDIAYVELNGSLDR